MMDRTEVNNTELPNPWRLRTAYICGAIYVHISLQYNKNKTGIYIYLPVQVQTLE